jgi:imidazolonepropionase-like amidohydrolase
MNRLAAFLIGSALATSALAQKLSLVGGTVINPADGKIIQNAVVVINGDKIESIASRKESGVPVGSRWVECDGKFILPGYIDTHVHSSSRVIFSPGRTGQISTVCGRTKTK